MDADLRRPTIHKRLGIQNVGGLSLILLHGKQHDTIARVPGIENLYVLTAGPKPPNPTELLESKRMRQLLQTIQDLTQLDVVVIDTSPALAFADAAIIAAQVDGVILTVNAQSSREASLIETMEAFKKVNASIIGIILIDVKQHKPITYTNGAFDISSKELSVLNTDDIEISSIDELIDLNISSAHPVDDKANMQHQESLVEPLNESTDENIDKDTYPVDIEDVTIIFPHPIKQGLRED